MEEEEDRYRAHAHIPIPTYEEATSSRPTSSQHHRGPGEISDDAERQNLLARSSYRAPTAESPRSSTDTDLGLPEMTGDGTEERRVIEELDYLDPSHDGSPGHSQYHRARLRSNLSKHLANLSATFSSLRIPSFRSLYTSIPNNDSSNPDHDRHNNTPSPRIPWWRRRPSNLNFTIPDQYRMSGATAARLMGLFFIGLTVWVFFAFDVFPRQNRGFGTRMNPEMLRNFAQQHVEAGSIANYLKYVSSYDHVAGTEGDLFLAKWMEEQWLELGGFDHVAMLEYEVYMNYPTKDGRAVRITRPEEKKGWKALLEEDEVGEDHKRKQTLVWHAHSKSGEATGPLVYANGGSREDFAWLRDSAGIGLNGTIALVRYFSTLDDPALKVRAAEEAGCAGVLMFSDPFQDGSAKGAVWPDGRWRPGDSVQRGSVSRAGWVVGDPLTPGWASTKGAQRVPTERSHALPGIPSLPLSWRDAEVLIEALQGHGAEVPRDWVGGTTDYTWFTGTGAKDSVEDALPEVHLKNLNDENDKQPIWNLHGVLEGIEQREKKILVGNHRDAWCFGSVSPGSGTAIMMEIIGIFGSLRQIGWRPLRTIEFSSWDGAEYNLVGSTEYVEDRLDYLRQHGVGYLNVEAGVFGDTFRAAGSPVYNKPLKHALSRVAEPHTNRTLKQTWKESNQELEELGTDSDYVPFQHIAGTSSIDLGFAGLEHSYPSHSCYETFAWMQKFGDPDFSRHHTLAQIWALMILELADAPIIPYDLKAYVAAMKNYVSDLERDSRVEGEDPTQPPQPVSDSAPSATQKRSPDLAPHPNAVQPLDVTPLTKALNKLEKQTEHFHKFEDLWTSNVLGQGGLETMNWAMQRRDYNERVSNFETDLLDIPRGDFKDSFDFHGLRDREQFKHVVYGPQAWDTYTKGTFPGVRDALAKGDLEGAQAQVEKVAKILKRAGDQLVDGLSY